MGEARAVEELAPIRRALALAMALAAALSLAAAAPSPSEVAAAARERGLFFRDTGTVKADWNRLSRGGVKVQVCNMRRRAATRVKARLVGFRYTKAKGSQALRVVARGLPARLAGGRCRSVTIRAPASSGVPEQGAYSGELLITSAGAGAIRRAVEVKTNGFKPPGPVRAASSRGSRASGPPSVGRSLRRRS